MPIPPGAPVARQYRLPFAAFFPTVARALEALATCSNTMRLIARFVVLMVAVFGVSLAFAWAWDKSDKPHDASSDAVHTAS